MNSAAVQLVCFDLGGVLIRICRSWAEACRAAGLDVRGEWSDGEPVVANWPELRRQLQIGAIDRPAYAQSLSAALDCLYSPDEIERIHHAWLLGDYAGVVDVIDRIHAAGVETASLSNTDHAHWEQMRDSPALQRLRHRHASHLLKLQKPDPAIYRAFEQQVGFAGPQIMFFDDLAENIRTAKSLGWRTVQIDHTGDTALQIESGLRASGVAI